MTLFAVLRRGASRGWRPVLAALAACACVAPNAAAAAAAAAGADYAIVERSVIGGEGGWDFLTFDAPGQRLFIARGDRVQVWSAASRTLVGEIAGTAGVHGVALAPALGLGFTTNGRANTVSVFQLSDLTVTATIAVPGRNPDALLYEPRSQRVYVFNGRSADVSVIDAVGLRLLGNIALGGKPEVAVSDDAGHVFVNLEDTSELLVIDQAAAAVRSRWPLGRCAQPTGLAIDVAHQRLFCVCANHQMVVVDATTGRRVAELPIGGEPDGAAFDPASGLAFSSNGDGTLTVVREEDPEHFTVAANVPTVPKARTLALDAGSHRIYSVTAAFGATPAATAVDPKPRPQVLPRSFTVLVLAPR